jgi:hypothetical protein
MQTRFLKNWAHLATPPSILAGMKLSLAVGALVSLAACSGGPPTPPPPENPAQVKADIKAREDFARDLPKPPDR